MVDELEIPRKSVELEDSGAHTPDIPGRDSSDESDQFMDASEGQIGPIGPSRAGNESPIPKTRVEKVDDEPSHGEVPGTAAYKLRTKDAVPDEVEIVPDGQRSRSSSWLRPEDRPSTPGGTPVPRIVAEKIDPTKPAYGDVPGTAAYELRKADARPDEIVRSPDVGSVQKPWDGKSPPSSPDGFNGRRLTGGIKGSPTIASRSESRHEASSVDESMDSGGGGGEDEGFGDDFDEFEEGQEADEEFGDFGGDDVPAAATPGQPPTTPQYPSIPILEFTSLDSASSISEAAIPYLRSLFPSAPTSPEESDHPPHNPKIFTSDRSHSLYTQLIAPPPLAPPNWLRSRIRRLFLVSLGVPVDLDEILPASKQKKLILPSINIPRSSSDTPTLEHASLSRLKEGNNDSSASVDSKGNPKKSSSRRKKEEPPPPEFDSLEAIRTARTTVEKLQGMSGRELVDHVKIVEDRIRKGKECLEYWERRKKEAEMEKEAFEGVVGRLVEYARKVRK